MDDTNSMHLRVLGDLVRAFWNYWALLTLCVVIVFVSIAQAVATNCGPALMANESYQRQILLQCEQEFPTPNESMPDLAGAQTLCVRLRPELACAQVVYQQVLNNQADTISEIQNPIASRVSTTESSFGAQRSALMQSIAANGRAEAVLQNSITSLDGYRSNLDQVAQRMTANHRNPQVIEAMRRLQEEVQETVDAGQVLLVQHNIAGTVSQDQVAELQYRRQTTSSLDTYSRNSVNYEHDNTADFFTPTDETLAVAETTDENTDDDGFSLGKGALALGIGAGGAAALAFAFGGSDDEESDTARDPAAADNNATNSDTDTATDTETESATDTATDTESDTDTSTQQRALTDTEILARDENTNTINKNDGFCFLTNSTSVYCATLTADPPPGSSMAEVRYICPENSNDCRTVSKPMIVRPGDRLCSDQGQNCGPPI